MRVERTPDDGLKLELDAREAAVFRYLIYRASFLDTPPDQQDAVLRMAGTILEEGYGEPQDG